MSTRAPDLSGATCVVTGASRGLGLDLARRLGTRGAAVAVCARDTSAVDEAADALRAGGARDVLAATVDVADPEALVRFARDVEQRLGPTYALVNNAGMLGPVGPLHEVDLDAWEHTVRVNLLGVAAACRAFVPQMVEQGRGRIVNLSGGGVGGRSLPGGVSAYTASKAAVVALTEVLAQELAPNAITVNAVAPGAHATGFGDDIERLGPDRAGAQLYEATVAQQANPAELEPYLQLVEFLLGDAASWLTGKLLAARWDDVGAIEANAESLVGGSLFTLRRIDDALFTEVQQ